jgi:biopolymer transport protein ExbB
MKLMFFRQRRAGFPSWKPAMALGVAALSLMMVCGSAKAWWDDNWSARKQITIDPGPKGGALTADAGRMPLLIRLSDGNFKFTDAKDDGTDIRFVDADDKTPLKYHIDTYDGLLGVALLWVDVPAVKIGQPTIIWMYYGNPKATAAGDPKGTYDPDTTLVYHFSGKDAPPRDETAYANNSQTAVRSIETGLIGRAIHLDGAAPVVLPASPSLAIPANGPFTWSAWIKADAGQSSILFAKRDAQNGMLIGLDQGVPYVTVMTSGAPARANGAAAIDAGKWHHIAVTASDHVAIFVDGKAAGTAPGGLPALAGAGSLGADSAADPTQPPAAAGFVGDLDELEISKTARSAGFIAAAFASQGPDGHLVSYGADEQNGGSGGGGYFGVILRSVTIDGWVVIAILAVMMAVSVLVMINKAIYINATARANIPFLDLFTRYGANIEELRAQVQAVDDHSMDKSILYRVYRASEEEMARRAAAAGSHDLILSPQAVATIRANVDRVAARESARLNALMVLLTIAISGGPFLGLLGTVVGVMITFAAIAASGDVNVNAIAPGIAAALVATVAGLAVAIPALFGYNYLLGRIKDITTEMNGFVDELVTRLAETYSRRPDPEQRMAAE